MTQDRRLFLKSLGVAGVAIVSLPEVSPLLNFLQSPREWSDDLETTLAALLLNEAPRGPFIANAKTILIEADPYKLLGAPAALLRIFDEMGLERRFSSCMGYHEAAQCRPHFESQETNWRDNLNFTHFTGVKRPGSDKDVAVAVGGNIDSDSNLVRAAGATQYQDFPAIALEKDDPDVGRAVEILLSGKLSGAESTQALALINKKEVDMGGGQTAMRYETPVNSSVYIPHARRTARVRNARGMIAANTKSDPERIYISDVYA